MMKKAVFFDRDGVINNDLGIYYIFDPKDFELNIGIIELLKWLKSKGFLLIIISNQGGISKGIYSHRDVENVHQKMNESLGKSGIVFDEIYYCPHHPDNENCLCRKPGSVQIEKAISRFSINASYSFFIGDRDTDIEAGKKSGLRTIKVIANQDMSDVISLIQREMVT